MGAEPVARSRALFSDDRQNEHNVYPVRTQKVHDSRRISVQMRHIMEGVQVTEVGRQGIRSLQHKCRIQLTARGSTLITREVSGVTPCQAAGVLSGQYRNIECDGERHVRTGRYFNQQTLAFCFWIFQGVVKPHILRWSVKELGNGDPAVWGHLDIQGRNVPQKNVGTVEKYDEIACENVLDCLPSALVGTI